MSLPRNKNIDGLTDRAVAVYDIFIQTLELHHGANNPAKSKKIEGKFNITGSEVTALRHLAWKKGVPIGFGRNGYFYAKTVNEWMTIKKRIDARAAALRLDSELCQKIHIKMAGKAQGTFL